MIQSTRAIGKKLENLFLAHLQELEHTAKLSNNSGAVSGNGDVVSKYFQTECKKRNTKDFSIKEDVFSKLKRSIPTNNFERIAVLVNENSLGRVLVTLELKDFFRLAKTYIETKELHGTS